MHIETLIADAQIHIPFTTETDAQNFLNKYSSDDQLALISALYIGREHIHMDTLGSQCVGVNRTDSNHIAEKEFAQILYEKGANVNAYYKAFLRCNHNSKTDLSLF